MAENRSLITVNLIVCVMDGMATGSHSSSAQTHAKSRLPNTVWYRVCSFGLPANYHTTSSDSTSVILMSLRLTRTKVIDHSDSELAGKEPRDRFRSIHILRPYPTYRTFTSTNASIPERSR